MVDIHHHLLPGLDDGSTDLETSLAMVRMAAEDGITHIVATPHANTRYAFDRDRNEELIAKLRVELAREGVAMTLGSGCDFHLSYDNIQSARQHPHRYANNGLNYLLIELPDHAIPPQMDDSFYDLRLAGITLILTHPERNPTLQRNPQRLKNWVQQGMLLQVTTSSVVGQMGSTAEKMARPMRSPSAWITRWRSLKVAHCRHTKSLATCTKTAVHRFSSGCSAVGCNAWRYSPSPPSTAICWPVMKVGAVAKKSTAAATSSAVPLRRIGVFSMKWA